jgi:spermidine synthase
MPAVLAVVAAFFGGLALGAWALDGVVSASPRPGRWYATLELVMGCWGLVSLVLLPQANAFALGRVGLECSAARQWTVAFMVPFASLLPATAAMGATLPAMERFVSWRTPQAKCVGRLYAANTFGAVAGTLLTTFALAPAVGFRLTLVILAALNLACGVVVWLLEQGEQGMAAREGTGPMAEGREGGGSPARRPEAAADKEAAAPARSRFRLRLGVKVRARGRHWAALIAWGQGQDADSRVGHAAPSESRPPALLSSQESGRRALAWTLFLTGLLGIGYEVVGVRVLGQVLENTVYSFAATLAVYLLGTAMGAGAIAWLGRRARAGALLAWLLWGLGVSCLAGAGALAHAPTVYARGRAVLGDSVLGVLGAEMAVAAMVFGLPVVLMGATFSLLAQTARDARGGVGWALGFNTLGAALAPPLLGVALVPALGTKWSLVSVASGYLTVWLVREAQRVALSPARLALGTWHGLGALLPAAMVCLLPANLRLAQLGPGERLRDYREGVTDSVAVVEDAGGHRTLRVNNRFTMGGTASAPAERRHAHLPLLLHPAPKRALFLGAGTGITFGAAGAHPGLEADAVELAPEVAAMMRHFAPENSQGEWFPRLRLFVADARRFVRVATNRYDVIVADLFHPARDGAGALYTREHYQAIRERLQSGGLFCQWLPLYQLDEPMLRVIVQTFFEVFPHSRGYLLRFNLETPVLGLVGTQAVTRYPPDWFEERVPDGGLREQLKPLALTDGLQLFGCLVASPEGLRRFATGAPLNTDDWPVVMFAAPRFVYRRETTAHERLFAWLDRREADPKELLEEGPEAGPFARRLAEYMAARDVYLRGLLADKEGRSAAAVDAWVESARLSQDFSTGYAYCLTLAVQQAQDHPQAARDLLDRLIAAQPDRPVAGELKKRLFGP